MLDDIIELRLCVPVGLLLVHELKNLNVGLLHIVAPSALYV